MTDDPENFGHVLGEDKWSQIEEKLKEVARKAAAATLIADMYNTLIGLGIISRELLIWRLETIADQVAQDDATGSIRGDAVHFIEQVRNEIAGEPRPHDA